MFGTSGIRGPVGDEVTADLALAVGRAVATEGADCVVVGRDPRESGIILSDALTAGLRECGADVIDVGMAATPTVARAVGWQDADAGVVITASHNPPQDNGIKLWNPSGQAFRSDQREAIEARIRAEEHDLEAWDGLGSTTEFDGVTDHHRNHLVERFTDDSPDLADLTVAVDVGNGAGGVTADALYELGCDVETLNAQPDGRFPSRPSEPTAENCASLRAHVAGTDADLGVAHDGDADRMMAVDGDGEFVPGDVLLALFAHHAVSPGGRVAAPLNTSLVVDDAIAGRDASVTRTRVGDVYVAERATESDVVFGGEPSGAWIWPDETLCPDGPLAACKLAVLVAERGPLAEQTDELGSYPIRRESLGTDEKRAVMDRVAQQVQDRYSEVETMDGVRVETSDGWFLVRASGTQPLVRITAEARSEADADTLFEEARALVTDAIGQ